MYKFQIGDEVCLSREYTISLNYKEIIYEVCSVSSISVKVRCKNTRRYEVFIKNTIVLHRSLAQIKLEERLAKINNLLK